MKSEFDLIKFQYYDGNIRHAVPRGFVSLGQFVSAHKSPTEKILKVFDQIEEAAKIGDKKLKSKLKTENLYYFTPGAIFKGRRKYSEIKGFTGLAQIDIDDLTEPEALDLKEYLFDNHEQFFCVYLSPSRTGVKGLMRIPIVTTIKQYKEYYQAIEDEFDWLPGFDSAPKNLALPLFISYDTDILYREDARVWNKIGKLQDDTKLDNLTSKPPSREPTEGDETVYKSDAYYRKITLDIFESKLNTIHDNGHPQLRSACLVLGSRVGAGYVDRSEAEEYASACIRANSYLRKGIDGYITTMKWCMNKAINNPKYYE